MERSERRLTREESQAQTRERLFQAARLVFARQGYGGASLDAIAAEAGFSKGAVYSNFDSKEALFLELLRRHMAQEIDELDRLWEGTRGRKGEVMRALRQWLDAMNSDTDWSMLSTELLLHARRNDDFAVQYETLFAAHRAAIGELVGRLFQIAGQKPPVPTGEIAGALMALAQGLALQRQRTTPGRSDPAGALIKLFLESLLAAPG
jgi:AcrR family transcriptional regulator